MLTQKCKKGSGLNETTLSRLHFGGCRGRQIVLNAQRIAIFTVPKCCSMTLSTAAQNSMEKEDWERLPVMMGDAPFLWEGHEHFKKYAFVRHPVERFLSGQAFMDPAGNPKAVFNYISNQKDEKRDQHYRSQSSFLKLDGELLPEKLIRVEDLPDAWPFLDWRMPYVNRTPVDKKPISEALERAILETFAEDLELWERAGHGNCNFSQ